MENLEYVVAQPGMIRINEVASAGVYDFIELKNITDEYVLLGAGWVLDNTELTLDKTPAVLKIPAGVLFPPRGFLLVCPFEEADAQTVLNNELIPSKALLDISFSMGDGEEIVLYYNQEIVDSFSWEGHVNSAGIMISENQEVEVFYLLSPTPGYENTYELMEINRSGLIINEINSRGNDFIELFNAGETAIDFGSGKWTIFDITKTNRIPIPNTIVLDPGSFITIFPKESTYEPESESNSLILVSDAITGFGLGSADSVFLQKNKQIIDYRSWNEHVESAGFIPESEEWSDMLIPTPGKVNVSRE